MPHGGPTLASPRCAPIGPVFLTLALLPSVLAIWAVPGFVTQDGPSHVYNAHILLESLRLGPDSPFASVYEPRWRPLPNLGGHLALMGLLTFLPPQAADRAMTTIALVGFASAIVWLRWRVAGPRGLGVAAVLAALLAINMPWLMGFSNFLVGATLALVTWGLWWGWRDQLSPARVAAIGGLLVLGYFGHLVSLGLTAAGLVALSATAPGADRRRRVARTLAACLPLVPLAVMYKALTSEGGAFSPSWEHTGPLLSPVVWARRASWIDPIALGRRDIAPLVPGLDGPWCAVLSPTLWLGLGLGVAAVATLLRRRTEAGPETESPGSGVVSGVGGRHGFEDEPVAWTSLAARVRRRTRGPRRQRSRAISHDADRPTGRLSWAALAGLLLLGAAVGPDGFGDDHGYFLTQRVALIGLACLVPALELDPTRRPGRVAAGLIGLALVLQSAFVWDYAIESDRRAGAILRAAPEVGHGSRVGTLLVDIRGRYRSNPLLHADCLLGVGTGNIVWSNYEARHYYFPVQIRPGLDAPDSPVFEDIALLDDPDDADDRARLWDDLLRRHGRSIDVVLAWGSDPILEAITARWAGDGPVSESASVRVYRRPEGREGLVTARR